MKKLIILFFVFLGITAQAQLMRGNSMFNAGFGLGMYQQGTQIEVPPVFASYEYMVSDNFSVGFEAGYYAFKFGQSATISGGDGSNTSVNASGKFTSFYGMALGNYYFLNEYNYNVYGGVKIGYIRVNGETESSIETADGESVNISSSIPLSGIGYDIHVGGRYMFTDNFGAFAELGYGFSIFRVGLTYKFGY